MSSVCSCSENIKLSLSTLWRMKGGGGEWGFGGLEVACWPLVPKFGGSNPAEAVGFFRAKKKNPQHAFPWRIFAACKITRKCMRGSRSFRSNLPAVSRPSSSSFHY